MTRQVSVDRQMNRKFEMWTYVKQQMNCMCDVMFVLCCQCIEGENTWRDLMKTALENLIVVLKDENTISPYEMCSSGLVQALFTVLNNVSSTIIIKSKQTFS